MKWFKVSSIWKKIFSFVVADYAFDDVVVDYRYTIVFIVFVEMVDDYLYLY